MIFFNFQLAIGRILLKLTYPQNVPSTDTIPSKILMLLLTSLWCGWVAKIWREGNTWESGIWVRWEYTGAQKTKTEIHRRLLWPKICANWLQTDQEKTKAANGQSNPLKKHVRKFIPIFKMRQINAKYIGFFSSQGRVPMPIKYHSADFVCKGVPLSLPVKPNSLIKKVGFRGAPPPRHGIIGKVVLYDFPRVALAFIRQVQALTRLTSHLWTNWQIGIK